MRLALFNLTKIDAEKKSNNFKDLKFESSLNLKDIKKSENEFNNSNKVFLEIPFVWGVNYAPDIAKINFEGNLVVVEEKERAEKILNDWSEKKLSEEDRLKIFNIILRKSSVKAAFYEEELNLPLHFQVPSLKEAKKE